MIEKLTIENFRAFEKYSIERLARVNLLLGRNNCGKTTVLEAVHLLAREGDFDVVAEILIRRGEVGVLSKGVGRRERYRTEYPDVSHFFRGHASCVGSRLRIAAGGSFQSVELEIEELPDERQPRLFDTDASMPQQVMTVARLNSLRVTRGVEFVGSMPVTAEGLLVDLNAVYRRRGRGLDEAQTPVVLTVTPESLASESMASLWEQVAIERREDEVLEAVRIIAPDVSDLVFLPGDGSSLNGRSGVLVGTSDSPRRVPIGSFGDGVRRLLALALCMSQARGGILLVDEIDTGLHHEKMADMWRMVIETARANDIQVFATTHSLDCERGLASAILQKPELAEDVAVHKITRNLDAAVTNSADDFLVALANSIEMR